MNEETEKFINDDDFNSLFDGLHENHKPQKAEIDSDKLRAIGLIIVKFQRLENTVRDFIGIIANIANSQRLVNIFTCKSSFRNLLAILSALAIEKGFHKIEDLKILLKKAGKAEEIRNQIVHSIWTSGPRVKSLVNKNSGIVHTSELYECGDLPKISETIDKLDTAIDALKFDWIDFCNKGGKTPNGVRYIKGGK